MRIQLIGKRESGMTGTFRYASELYRGFKDIGLNSELTFPTRTMLPVPLHNHLKKVRIDLETFFANYPLRINLTGADVYHLTSQMLATLLLFQRFPKPVVVTVLDIIPYLVRHLPELNTFRHPADYMFYQLALAGLRRADGIIAISEYTRRTLVEMLKLPAERIHLVYPGIDQKKFRPLSIPEAFCQKYGLDRSERYILFVGSEDPRKNLPTLMRALAQIKQQMPGVRLLKVGPAHFKQERQKLQALITKLDLHNEVVFFDYVPDEDLPYFYNASELLIMPSLHEGFGLPVVEAMACRTPVVCSWASSLPEVAGEAGIYVDPNDPQKMADTLLRLLDNPKERLLMKQAGEQQAAKFTQNQSAYATREVYGRMLRKVSKKYQLGRSFLPAFIYDDQASKKRRTKIAIVVPSFPSFHCGVSTYSNYLVKELRKQADVEIVSRTSSFSPSPGSILKEVEDAIKHVDIIHVQHAFDLYGYMGHLTFPLYRLLKKSGKPVVTTLHEMPDLRSKNLKMQLALVYLKSCIREIVQNSDVVLVHTQATLDLLARWQHKKGILVIPHGTINRKIVTNPSLSSPNTPTIGFFGFITENKGIHRLFDALANLPDARLVIAGEPRTKRDQIYLASLKSKATDPSIGGRVEFLGFLPDHAMSDFFQAVDLMVFPYSSSTASGALHLAMAHKCVILTSNLPVFHELKIRYDCLEEFELGKPDHLVDQINWLLGDSYRRNELVAGCQRMMEDTSWVEVAKITNIVYENLMMEFIPQKDVLTSERTIQAQVERTRE